MMEMKRGYGLLLLLLLTLLLLFFFLDAFRVAVKSRQTKHELPAICVFGLRPRFFLGIWSTASMLALVNAAIEPSIAAVSSLLSSSRAWSSCCWAGELTVHTVGVRNVQPPSQDGSRRLGGRPRRRFKIGSPVAVKRI